MNLLSFIEWLILLSQRLLTWRPAGAEGEHLSTQSLPDKQLVFFIYITNYFFPVLVAGDEIVAFLLSFLKREHKLDFL